MISHWKIARIVIARSVSDVAIQSKTAKPSFPTIFVRKGQGNLKKYAT
jgi:hypothetical protein